MSIMSYCLRVCSLCSCPCAMEQLLSYPAWGSQPYLPRRDGRRHSFRDSTPWGEYRGRPDAADFRSETRMFLQAGRLAIITGVA